MMMDASAFPSDVFISGVAENPECSSADGLAAVIASCSPLIFQGLEEPLVCGNSSHKRLYSVMDDPDAGDEEFSDEILTQQVESKKRRLSVEQVKALEKNFEVENKLEPERKIQLARELGLQPRQVAVWFQNRRARWKTKQLEKDYDLLKSEYDDLKSSYVDLVKDKDLLQLEVSRLQERLAEFRSAPSKTPEATPATAGGHVPVARVKLEVTNSEDGRGRIGAGGFDFVCRKEGSSLSSESDASEVLEQEPDRIVAAGFLLHENCFHHREIDHHQNTIASIRLRPQQLLVKAPVDESPEPQAGAAFSWPWDPWA